MNSKCVTRLNPVHSRGHSSHDSAADFESRMAPEQGFEPSTLRLIDLCHPFRNSDSNSLSAAAYRQLPWFATGVAVQTALMAFQRGSMLLIAIDVSQEVQLW